MSRHQPSDAVRLSIAEATALGTRALEHIGYSSEEAAATCAHLVDAACCGYHFAGLPRILEIADDPRTKEARQPIRVVRETPVSMLVDGGNHIGYYAIYKTALMAIDKAKQAGIALVGLYNCALSGRNTYYLELIARENLAGMLFSSAWPVVAPEGGARPMLGTNPMAIALPTGNGPLIFDMGTAAIMRGELALRSRLNKELPEGVAIDANGLPTRDPHEALKGSILPFGGVDRHKGYGLSLTIQALGLLAGASLPRGRVQDYAQLFVVFSPGLLIPEDQFKHDINELIKLIKATPLRPGVDEIRIPSERAFRERERARKEGLLVDRKVFEALKKMASAQAGIQAE
ncbi:MAG: Ldh family oxidoreductase [Betaproteobacteria bacterium]|nr:Ldh family oxidoreductase [Betaproteobacteria bacterium]